MTQLHFYSWWGFPAYRPRTVIQPGYQGTLGYGYPTALGAKVGRPDRAVVYVGGDGGFMFNCQEISTALRFGIGVVAVVFNDNAFGNVRRTQKEMFGGRHIASDLRNPDFGKFAESFGMDYGKVDLPETLEPALERAIAAGRAGLHRGGHGRLPQSLSAHVLPQGARLNGGGEGMAAAVAADSRTPRNGAAALRDRFGERCATGESVRRQHGNLLSEVPNQPPDAVLFPQTTEEVAEIVRICARPAACRSFRSAPAPRSRATSTRRSAASRSIRRG